MVFRIVLGLSLIAGIGSALVSSTSTWSTPVTMVAFFFGGFAVSLIGLIGFMAILNKGGAKE